MFRQSARPAATDAYADIGSDALALARTIDRDRRHNWLAKMLRWGAALLCALSILSLLGVFPGSWPVALAVGLLLVAGSRVARRGSYGAAFWLAFLTVLGGILVRPIATGNLLSAAMFLPLATMFLVLVAERHLRVVVGLAGFVALGLVTVFTSDAASPPLGWSILAATGVIVSVLTVVLGGLALQASHSTLIDAFIARDRARELADQRDEARRDLERNVHLATRDLRKVLAATEELVEQLETTAMRDYLTGLYNRRFLDQELPRQIALARRQGSTLAVAMIDLVKFKYVNDRFSHSIGDQVLARTGEVIAAALPPNTILSRFGGDEFIVLAPDSDGSGIERVLREVQDTLAESAVSIDPPIKISMVYGVALFRGDTSTEHQHVEAGEPDRLLSLASVDLQRRRGAPPRLDAPT
jgi:diguanylate cyclase (GGDEF)-like protein